MNAYLEKQSRKGHGGYTIIPQTQGAEPPRRVPLTPGYDISSPSAMLSRGAEGPGLNKLLKDSIISRKRGTCSVSKSFVRRQEGERSFQELGFAIMELGHYQTKHTRAEGYFYWETKRGVRPKQPGSSLRTDSRRNTLNTSADERVQFKGCGGRRNSQTAGFNYLTRGTRIWEKN